MSTNEDNRDGHTASNLNLLSQGEEKMFDNIPEDMQRIPHWICWHLKDVADGKGGKRQTKVPFRMDGRPASTTDPKDWVTFDAAVRAQRVSGKFSGIGFVFTRDSGFVGIDLDKCRDLKTGETEAWAEAILNELSSYTELSQSGRGWHAIVKGSLPEGGNRRGRVEMYDHDRYFVMTGKRAANSCRDIQVRDLTRLHARLLSGKLDPQLAKPQAGRNAKVTDKSPSGKDFALIGSLARELCTNNAMTIDSEMRNRYPKYYACREFAKSRPGGYWIYSIERFLKYRRGRIFRKPVSIHF
jgi:primase-polymerase (primpol)-like protein